MKSSRLTRSAVLAAASCLALTLGACSSGDSSGKSAASSASGSGAPSSSSASAADQPFGAGCSAVPTEGPGSFTGMSGSPVATAASANPALSTLVQVVTTANLADSLNSTQDITVLAPANPAFQAIPADQLNTLVGDVPQLTAVLTHHVLQGRLAPDELAGKHTTLNNDSVTIEGSGENFTISGDQTLTGQPATVVCGNITTANATVYIIDQVLKPAG